MTLRNRPWLVTAAACLILFLVLAFIKFTQIRAAIAFGESFPEPSESVHSQITQLSTWRPVAEVVGEIRASRELELKTETRGVVAVIGFSSGESVTQGQILLQLDIAEEEAQLAALTPQIELAKKDVKRLSGAVKSRSVSQQLADQAKSNLAVLNAQVASIREIIANKTVLAPFDGQTGLHDFEVGEFIDSGTSVTRLVGSLSTLWVDFSLPQQYANFAVGEQVQVSPLRSSSSVSIKSPVGANVIAVEPRISSDSRSISARAEINNSAYPFKPGAIVSVTAPVDEETDVIRLPSTAIRVDTFGRFVYLLNQDSNGATRSHRKPVTVLAKQGQYSMVSAELGANLEVATVGSFKLRDGILTHVKEAPIADSAPMIDTLKDAVAQPTSEQRSVIDNNAHLEGNNIKDNTKNKTIDETLTNQTTNDLLDDEADQ